MDDCSALSVENALRANAMRIEEFSATAERIVLELFE
jgi:hypothetical protein